MKKIQLTKGVLVAVMSLILTGCGGFIPDMTGEEERAVSEYAANLILKYDANNRSRLVSREEVKEKTSELLKKEEYGISESEQGGMEPVDDTPIIEIGQETGGGNTADNMEAFYELPDGISVVYQGRDVADSYSAEDDIDDYFTLDATEGKKLLILNFCIENQSQTEQRLDFLAQGAEMKVMVNGSGNYNILTTMLLNDMSTYVGVVSADESIPVVLLAEVDSNIVENIASLSLKLKNDSKICTISLP